MERKGVSKRSVVYVSVIMIMSPLQKHRSASTRSIVWRGRLRCWRWNSVLKAKSIFERQKVCRKREIKIIKNKIEISSFSNLFCYPSLSLPLSFHYLHYEVPHVPHHRRFVGRCCNHCKVQTHTRAFGAHIELEIEVQSHNSSKITKEKCPSEGHIG